MHVSTETFIDPARLAEPHDIEAVLQARLVDPFAFLGPHPVDGATVVRTFQPQASAVRVLGPSDQVLATLTKVHPAGLFAGAFDERTPYRLEITTAGSVEIVEDPYRFGVLLGDLDLHLVAEGRHHELYSCLGAQHVVVDGVAGVRFAVWAPNARRVSVIGDFNDWDGRRHPMRLRHQAGVWEMFIPQLRAGQRYKYELVDRDGRPLPDKADPMALATEAPPATASVIGDPEPFRWTDAEWLEQRAARPAHERPISVYEVHVGSWLRDVNDPVLGWQRLADRLIPYATGLGFTHLELMPIMEHPFGGSWGYQPLGLFAPTARYGSPRDFAAFVDRCHAAGLGVILDWVPAHFPSDAHGLATFDGTSLYEYADPKEGFHRDWNSLIYNLGRNEVRGFMIASALIWLERYHVDGLRVDAVASMLYRDYSRNAGEWIPNIYGGRENLEAVAFLREFNAVVAERCPGVLTIAEESTAWPGVSRPIAEGGLGFSFKWNMGWMHDSLSYIEQDPIYRQWHHDQISFGFVYAWSERFVLPISHDEVVHGKGSLINKMPGEWWQKFANLRAYLAFMWCHPGKKLLFMGSEIAQWLEWNHDAELDWPLLEQPMHAGVQRLVRDLNHRYVDRSALHARDASPDGFEWVIGDDRVNSVFAWLRRDGDQVLLAVMNFTPTTRFDYRVGVPVAGEWRECLNSDSAIYGGSNIGNSGLVRSDPVAAHGREQSLNLTLPPLSVIWLEPDR
ncbi:1,4-alpha-glucan branching protein GlgB [soil metagenome]